MNRQHSRAVAKSVAAVAGALLLWLGATAAMLWATLEAVERNQVAALLGPLLGPRLALLAFAALLWLAGLAAIAARIHHRWVAAPARLLEATRVALATDARPSLANDGSADLQALAQVIAQLVDQRLQLRQDMALQVQAVSQGIAQERNRLAALMAELSQAVVVCNLDGLILLYNASARAQFRALSQSPGLADGAELIGLGRSIYKVFDRKLLAHALDKIDRQEGQASAEASVQFITSTASGQLLRVQMAPVRAVPLESGADGQPGRPALNGFVLMLANITREFEQAAERDQWLIGLTEGSRASLGSLSAAVEMLDYPDLDDDQRRRFQAVVHDELRKLGQRLQDLAARSALGLATRWPLEDMLGADLVAAALRRIASRPGLRAAAAEVDPSLWLKVDSFALLQALGYLASRLADEYGIPLVTLRLSAAGVVTEGSAAADAGATACSGPASAPRHAHLDLVWTGPPMSTETVMSWEADAMRSGAELSPLTVREVVQRHGGEFWFERERVRHQAFFRFLLPTADAADAGALAALATLAAAASAAGAAGAADRVASAPAVAREPADSRPAYYDFDLFRADASAHSLDDRALVELAFTVFDTETTGLNPSQGDEIIQIGAARLVNGRLLRQECFEQLVDPQRDIPAAGLLIHGITPAMLRGQPAITSVLPAFHAFARDTVLVAHNAAFDMRFLQLKEAATGLRFDQPVLDTLLLSAVVHPNQASHGLEAMAERLAIPVRGRHSALGDALLTAEVFQKLVPLLAEMGIRTLGEARAAAQKTAYARLKY